MLTRLLYGIGGLSVDIPDDATVVEPIEIPGAVDEEGMVSASLREPIGTKPLKQLVKSSDKVAIVISDITRPTPNHKLLPWILHEMPHVPQEQIVILNGTGTHRDQTRDEFVQMLGERVVDRVKVVNHHCQEPDELVMVGTSSFGCGVYMNKAYVEADFRISTGFIEPHFFAGFSGGPKAIMPGIAGLETILAFHNARMIGDPLSTWGNMENNPLQRFAREVNLMCKPDFIVNVTLNDRKEITGVFSGELFEAHAKGCAFVKEHSMVRCDERFDIVVTTNSGYPLDQNLYQAVKGMSAAQKIVKKGGAILCAAECSDGIPEHGNYFKILKMADTPEQLLNMIKDPSFQMFDQWQVQKQATVQIWADVYLYSGLPADKVKQAKLVPIADLSRTLNMLKEKYGNDATVAVLPQGPQTIPYVDD